MYRSAVGIVVFIVLGFGSSTGQSNVKPPSELYLQATKEMRLLTIRTLCDASNLSWLETISDNNILSCNIRNAKTIKDICFALAHDKVPVSLQDTLKLIHKKIGFKEKSIRSTKASHFLHFQDSLNYYKEKCKDQANLYDQYRQDSYYPSTLSQALEILLIKHSDTHKLIDEYKRSANEDTQKKFFSSHVEKINQIPQLKILIKQKDENLWNLYQINKDEKTINDYLIFFSGSLSQFGSHLSAANSIRMSLFLKELNQNSLEELNAKYDNSSYSFEKKMIDSVAWQKAIQKKSIEALKAYQFHFPFGKYYQEAESKIQAKKMLNLALIVLGIAFAMLAFSLCLHYYPRKKTKHPSIQKKEEPLPSFNIESISLTDSQADIKPDIVKVHEAIIEEMPDPLPILVADAPALEKLNLKEFHYLGVPTFQGAFENRNIKPGQNAESLFVLRLDKEKGKGYFSIQLTPKKLKQLHDQAFQSIEIAFEANCPYLFNSLPKVEIISEGTLVAHKRTWVIEQKLKLNFAINETK